MALRVKWSSVKAFFFENRSARQTVMKNTFWLAMSNFAGRLIRAGLIIYSARVLGAAGYGIFSYALGIAGFFAVLSDIGVSAILTREISKKPEVVHEYISTSLLIKIVLIVISAVFVITIGPHFTKVMQALPLLPFAAALLAFDGIRDFILSISRAKEKMEIEGVVNVITNLGITAIGIVILFLRPTPRSLIAGYTLGSGVGMLAAILILREFFRSPFRNFRKSLLKPILLEALPFGLMSLLGSIMLSSDTIMLGWLSNATTLGIYSAAQRPVQVLYAIPGFLSGALFPSFARLAGENGERFRYIFERAIAFSLLLAIPMVVGGLVLGRSIVLLLFGPQYLAAQISFMILLATLITNFPSGFLANAVFAHGRQKLLIASVTLGGLGNIVFDYLLIPHWGSAGSCVATIVSQVASQAFLWYKMKQIRPFKTLPHLKKIILAAAAMAAVVFGLQEIGTPVILNIVIGAIAYGAVLLALKEKLLRYLRPSLEPSPSA
jgi:O-antigen/teichoic acid export membrane protein